MKNDRIKDRLDACLGDVCVSAALHNEIMYRATVPAPVRRPAMPKRLIAAAVAALLMLGTAAAITIAEFVHREMEPVRRMETDGRPGAWSQVEKLAIIDLMLEWGFDLDQEKLALLGTDLPAEEAELLTYEIIWDCIGERLQAYWRSQSIPTDQPEEFPLSSGYALYEALWLMNAPEADLEEIRASYEEWEAQILAEATLQPAPTPVPGEDPRYAVLLRSLEGYMADAMSMSSRERSVAAITAELNEAGTAWQVVISVKASLLREETREWFHRQYLYGHADYDAGTDTYSYPYVFTAEGRSGDAASLEAYEWQNLIPQGAYPPMPEKYGDYPYFDPFKQFRLSSAAEKAAFSEAWKPVADAWLAEHPDFHAKLKAENPHNPYYLMTRHRYGTPPEGYIQEDKALYIAVMHSVTLRPDVTVNQLMNRCCQAAFYDVCDPDNPMWKVHLMWDPELCQPDDPMADFMVIIDPKTGKVIADQRTLSAGAATEW